MKKLCLVLGACGVLNVFAAGPGAQGPVAVKTAKATTYKVKTRAGFTLYVK